jgi:hypothetical protein
MMFATPLILLGLAALPPLYWLLRLTPPAPRRIAFPPILLLQNLPQTQRSPQRLPLAILVLRLLALALLILGLADPEQKFSSTLPGTGPILIVIDNDWSTAADWPARLEAAQTIIATAATQNRAVALLPTAALPTGQPPVLTAPLPASLAANELAALQPGPWPSDPTTITPLLQTAPETTRLYIADGLTSAGFDTFLTALHPTQIFSANTLPNLLGSVSLTAHGSLLSHLISGAPNQTLLAKSATGATLASAPFDNQNNATIALPPAITNRIASLSLSGPQTAGSVLLLDSSTRAQTIGLATGSANAETPFLGTLYFLRRALPNGTQIITGSFENIANQNPGMIILADFSLPPAAQTTAASYVTNGGILVRFSGPLTAAAPDPFNATLLLPGDRRLGGALSWTTPEPLASFPATSPFASLPRASDITVSRQTLADPTSLDPTTIWASLADGTPLIVGKPMGNGILVNILTTANSDWSNFPLSGQFPEILARLTQRGHQTASTQTAPLPLQSELTAFGALTTPIAPASLIPTQIDRSKISPAHPPGLYGTGESTIAFNLGPHIQAPQAASLKTSPLNGAAPPHQFGPTLIAAAMALLCLDLLISLSLRGLLRRPGFSLLLLLCLLPLTAHAQTKLGYIITGDPATDQISADGLTTISADVSAKSSAQLGAPSGLNPANDDLSPYPLIYWPLLANSTPAQATCDALASYMAHGGLLIIDTKGGDADAPGSGAGFAPGAATALARASACLALPPLEPLTPSNVLAHCFFILQNFPGRFTGAPLLIATAAARDADDVTPIIITSNDFSGAWARDATGAPEQNPIPGGEAQREQATRFGINLVIYALTGSYKADQNSVATELDKLTQ